MPESKNKILIIDDEKDLVQVASLRLKANGFFVSEAFTVEEGLRKIAAEKPDLVLLDVALPDGNGYEVCRKLKADAETKEIVVVIFTASSQKELAEKAIEIGAADYVIKPFEPKDLLDKIRSALE